MRACVCVCTPGVVVYSICMPNIVVRGRIRPSLVGMIKRHLKPVVCVCYRAPCSTADRLTASSHNTPLTLCSASRSTHTTDQRKEAGDAFGVFSAFPSETLHFSLHRNHCRCTPDISDWAVFNSLVIFIFNYIFTDRNLMLFFYLKCPHLSCRFALWHVFLISSLLHLCVALMVCVCVCVGIFCIAC